MLPGRRGVTPVFGYGVLHPNARGTLTLLIWALPSTHYGPLRHPTRPGLSLAGFRLGSRALAAGASRVAVDFRVQTCRRHYPGGTAGCSLSLHFPTATAAFPVYTAGSAPASRSFEACSAFTHVTACMLAESPKAILFIEGFDGFVTSSAAPIATGWSDPLPGGNCTHWKSPPFHGAQCLDHMIILNEDHLRRILNLTSSTITTHEHIYRWIATRQRHAR